MPTNQKTSLLNKLWLIFRGAIFWVIFLPSIILLSVTLTIAIVLPIKFRIGAIKLWIRFSLFWLKLSCGLDYEVEGLENIPETGFIVMSKHSSTWETIVIQLFFRPLVWVVKKELTRIPFFGWGLKSMNAIAINRGTGRKAINQLVKEGKERMDEGRIVMLFPEGTRVIAGEHKPFKLGGAILAQKTGYSILPIAHNAGEFWPRHSWIKWPGTIKLVIGAPILPEHKTPKEIIAEVESWITGACEQISDKEQLKNLA